MTDRSHRSVRTRFDVFLSHSHAEKDLARALKIALERFPRPLWGVVAHRVFLDEHGVRTGDPVWDEIESAVRDSRRLLVLASPNSAGSAAVAREVSVWIEHRPEEPVLLALCGGNIRWDDGHNDFDSAATNAVSKRLFATYRAEPKWTNLTGTDARDLGLPPRRWPIATRDRICQLVGAIRGLPPDQVLRTYQRARRLRILTMIAGLALVCWLTIAEAIRERQRALDASLESGFHELGQHRLDAARTQFEQVLQARHDDPEPLAGIALVELAANRPDSALARIDAWIAEHGEQSALRVVKADALRRLHRDHEAQALEDDLASSGSALECYLRSIIELDRRERGLAVRMDPHRLARLSVQRSTTQRAMLHFQLARTAAATRDRDEAIDIADTIERHWPTNAQSLFYAAVALRHVDPQRTLGILKDLASRPTANGHDHSNLAQALLELNRVDEAEAAVDRAIREDGGAANAMRAEVKARVLLRRFENSREPTDLRALVNALRQACTDHPESVILLDQFGHALAQEGRRDEAIATMRLAVARGSDDVATFHNLGALLLKDNSAEARTWFEQAVAAHRRQGTDAIEARLALARARLVDDPTRPEGLLELTRLHAETGSVAVGMECARTLLEDGRASAADDVLAAMQVNNAELGPVIMLRSALAAARGRWHETRRLLGDWEPPLTDRNTAGAVLNMLSMAGDFEGADRLLTRLRSTGQDIDDDQAMVAAFKSAHADLRARPGNAHVDGTDRGTDLLLGIAAVALEDWGQAAHSFLRVKDALEPFQLMAASAAARVALSPQVEPSERVRAEYSQFTRGVVTTLLANEAAKENPERRLRASIRLLAEVPGLASTREPHARSALPAAEQEAWESAWRKWDRYR